MADYSRYIETIDTYIEEPNSINREWVELLREARDLFGCIEQLIAERDKAVEDMRYIVNKIATCKYRFSDDDMVSDLSFGRCDICTRSCRNNANNECNFIWRGLEGSGE